MVYIIVMVESHFYLPDSDMRIRVYYFSNFVVPLLTQGH